MGYTLSVCNSKMPERPKVDEMGELLSNIAHHWRQPLHLINLGAQEIKELFRRNELDEASLDELVGMLNDQITYLSCTIDEFRSFFTTETEESEFSVYDVVKNAIRIVSAAMEAAQIAVRLEVNRDFTVTGNRLQLQRVLTELLHNARDAVKETPFHLRIVTLLLDGEKRQITVENRGEPIPESVMPSIFEPYFTTKFKSRDAGVGLYMCRMIVERDFYGAIDLNNTEEGVRATLDFPVSAA
jgi:C4-dicarboxylate-specific signal transduction histidine kinase